MVKKLSYVFVLAAMFANGVYGVEHRLDDQTDAAKDTLQQFSAVIKETRQAEQKDTKAYRATEKQLKTIFNTQYISKSAPLKQLLTNDNALATVIKDLLKEQQLDKCITEYTRISISENGIVSEDRGNAELSHYSVTPPVYKDGWHKTPQEIIKDKSKDEYINEKYKFHISIKWDDEERTKIKTITIW